MMAPTVTVLMMTSVLMLHMASTQIGTWILEQLITSPGISTTSPFKTSTRAVTVLTRQMVMVCTLVILDGYPARCSGILLKTILYK